MNQEEIKKKILKIGQKVILEFLYENLQTTTYYPEEGYEVYDHEESKIAADIWDNTKDKLSEASNMFEGDIKQLFEQIKTQGEK